MESSGPNLCVLGDFLIFEFSGAFPPGSVLAMMLDWIPAMSTPAGDFLAGVGFICDEVDSMRLGFWALDVALILGSTPGSASIFNLAFVERLKD